MRVFVLGDLLLSTVPSATGHGETSGPPHARLGPHSTGSIYWIKVAIGRWGSSGRKLQAENTDADTRCQSANCDHNHRQGNDREQDAKPVDVSCAAVGRTVIAGARRSRVSQERQARPGARSHMIRMSAMRICGVRILCCGRRSAAASLWVTGKLCSNATRKPPVDLARYSTVARLQGGRA